jgi:hypothetical protein
MGHRLCALAPQSSAINDCVGGEMPRSSRIVLISILFLITGFLSSIAQEQKKREPLSEGEIIRLLQGGVSADRIRSLAQEFGISFEVTAAAERDLRDAGAPGPLIQALREIVPQAAPPKPAKPGAQPAAASPPVLAVESTPGSVQVFVDDELIARTSAEGRLKIPTLSPGKHRLRLAHDGYRDFEMTVELGSTGTTTVLATLQAAEVAPPSPPKPQPATARPAPKAYLGVGIQNLTPESAKAFAAPDTSGALVEEVDPKGPAAAGLQSGDVIRSFKGKALANASELKGLVGAEEPGTEIGLGILRNGRALSLQVRLVAPPTEARLTSLHVSQGPFAGLTLIQLTDFWRKLLALPAETHGVIVSAVEQDSPAANAGIAADDIIEQVNREKVSSLDDFRALTGRARGSVLLHLNRQGKALFFTLAARP